MNRFSSCIRRILGSPRFFLVVVGLLIIQAAWLALTARYPMAFDENFHFGIIQLYAHQWSPFFTSAPPNSAAYGDLVRNPSYLYQYLMSFPYRLIAIWVHNTTAQIIILRFLNIGLFSAGLVVFHALLRRLRFSAAITNFSLFMLILIPVVPFLAGQINYDNLMFLVIPVVTLLTLSCSKSLRETGHVPISQFIVFLIVSLLASLVKYAFLPVFLALVIYLIATTLYYKHHRHVVSRGWQSFRSLRKWTKVLLVIGLLLSAGLFIERYGVNIVQYHSLQPDCSKIESVDECLQYGPWARNYVIKANNEAAEATSGKVPLQPALILFVPAWVQGMLHRLYFAINYDFLNYTELPLPISTALVVGLLGLGLLVVFSRRLFRAHPVWLLPLTVIAIYSASLFYVNFTDYLHFRTMLAINGRYLILILPLLFALVGAAYSVAIHRWWGRHASVVQATLATIVVLLSLQGAGVLTYIVRSDDSWYWPSPVVRSVNDETRHLVRPLIFGAGHREISQI